MEKKREWKEKKEEGIEKKRGERKRKGKSENERQREKKRENNNKIISSIWEQKLMSFSMPFVSKLPACKREVFLNAKSKSEVVSKSGKRSTEGTPHAPRKIIKLIILCSKQSFTDKKKAL